MNDFLDMFNSPTAIDGGAGLTCGVNSHRKQGTMGMIGCYFLAPTRTRSTLPDVKRIGV